MANPTAEPLAAEFPPRTGADWRAAALKALKGGDLSALSSTTYDGIVMALLAAHRGAASSLAGGWPAGGAHVCSLVAEPTAEAANAAMREELAGGADGIVLQLARPGQPGLAAASLAELKGALAGIDLAAAELRLRGGLALRAAPADDLAVLFPHADGRHHAFGLDPFGECATGALADADLDACLAWGAGLARQARFAVFAASGRFAHEAGGSEAQELAAMLGAGVACLRALEAAGLDSDGAARAVDLELAADTDIVATIAKLRAARLVWARALQASGAAEATARLSVQTSARMMAARDVHTNMVRTACAAFAAAVGGTDTLTVLPFSHALGRPDAFARRIARNAALMLREESWLGAVADPAAGAAHIEELTAAFAERAWELFRGIEAEGGLAASLASGSFARRVAEVRAARAADIAAGRFERIGVTVAAVGAEAPPATAPWQTEPSLAEGTGLRPTSLAEAAP